MPRPLLEIVPASGPTVEAALRVGGAPPLVSSDWPRCGSCGEPMAFRFSLVTRASALELAPFAVVRVFQCENRTFNCRPDLPDAGANRVIGAEADAGEHGTVAYGVLRPAHEDTQALSVDLDTADSEQLYAYEQAQEAAPTSKVGGVPVWLQGPQAPECCGEPMEFIAQLEGDRWGLPFGDGGAGYVFRCAREPARYAFLTQFF